MVIPASRDESRFVPHPLLELESEDAAVEVERALDIRHLEVDVADVDARIDETR